MADGATQHGEVAALREELSRLQRANAIYQLVLDTMPLSIFWKDPENLSYLGCNRQFARDAGRDSAASMLGATDSDMIWAPEAELYRSDDRAVLESGQARINYEEPQTRDDGTEAWLRTSKIPLHAADGTLLGVLGLYEDITERKRTELDRDQMILIQQSALRELSTPLIPLADNVVVMPIIGTINTERAQQIMETLLEGIAANQADVALLDISGVRVVDTQVADALMRVAQAAKLLGTQIVITGIRAEVAQTIVHLGTDMARIITRSNLRDGLRYALALAGTDISPDGTQV
jgi:rsbT co-antagonist protein RsbR